jgi:hypothetical protein
MVTHDDWKRGAVGSYDSYLDPPDDGLPDDDTDDVVPECERCGSPDSHRVGESDVFLCTACDRPEEKSE